VADIFLDYSPAHRRLDDPRDSVLNTRDEPNRKRWIALGIPMGA
jgi:hypothetical protein